MLTLSLFPVTGEPVLNWKAVSGAQYYEIYRADGDGEFVLLASQAELSYSDLQAYPDSLYTYKVVAVADDSRLNSESDAKSIYAACPSTVITVALGENGKPEVEWDSVDAAKEYHIYRSTKSTSGFKKIGTASAEEYCYTDSKASKGKTYYYKVVVVCENTESAFSNVAKIKSK